MSTDKLFVLASRIIVFFVVNSWYSPLYICTILKTKKTIITWKRSLTYF